MSDTTSPDDALHPVPQHKSKAGIIKLIVQGLALLVAIANHFWELEFEFTETHAAIVIGVLESLWQGKQHKERKRLRKQAENPTGKGNG